MRAQFWKLYVPIRCFKLVSSFCISLENDKDAIRNIYPFYSQESVACANESTSCRGAKASLDCCGMFLEDASFISTGTFQQASSTGHCSAMAVRECYNMQSALDNLDHYAASSSSPPAETATYTLAALLGLTQFQVKDMITIAPVTGVVPHE